MREKMMMIKEIRNFCLNESRFNESLVLENEEKNIKK